MSRRKTLLAGAAVLLLLFLGDFCRVQVSLSRTVASATLGQSVQQTKVILGEPTQQNLSRGRHGSGGFLVYKCPYVWEPLLALAYHHVLLRIGDWGAYPSGRIRWYLDDLPAVYIDYDEAGKLIEVHKRQFSSKSWELMKSSLSH